MSALSQKTVVRSQKQLTVWLSLVALAFGLLALTPVWAEDLEGLCASRTAIERVYYQHRLGQKPPFEQVSPASLIERLVKDDLRKEAALKKVYGVEITPTLLEGEVQRIKTTTRAPEMLAEIKAALGNDPVRFANAFAKLFLVQRLLREKFDNDDTLHAPPRREIEATRSALLAAKANGASDVALLALLESSHSNAVTKIAWQLDSRPAEEPGSESSDEIEIKKRFGPDAQLLSAPHTPDAKERKPYFGDLPAELQRVLRVQLRHAGDVSSVVETSTAFLLYLCEAKTDETLTVGCLMLSKRSYEQWLEEQGQELSSVTSPVRFSRSPRP